MSDDAHPDAARVLAALTDKPTPAAPSAEDVAKMLEGVTDGPWWTEPAGTVRNDADGEPRYDLPRVVRVGLGVPICKAHLQGGKEPDEALANARFIAWARTAVPALSAERDALVAELHLMKTAGIIEVAVRNPSVFDYVKHWEAYKWSTTAHDQLSAAAHMTYTLTEETQP